MDKLNSKLNILVIDSSTYPLTYGYMQEIFGNSLPVRGHKVTWLLMSKDAKSWGELRRLGSTDVILFPMMNGRGRVSATINYFYYKLFMARSLPDIFRNRDIDIVFVRNQVRVGFLAYLFCKKNNIPFVYYLGYPHIESHLLAARRGYRKHRTLDEIVALCGIPLRNWITRRADFVFTMSDYWAEQVIEELGIYPDKVKSLPAGFDASIDPETADGAAIRKQFNLDNHPTLFYMGTISPPRDVPILADILAEVVKYIPDARLLLLYGNGEEGKVPLLRQRFAEKGVDRNVVFAPPVTYKQVPDYIAASHVGLSPIEPIPLYNVSSPYKLSEMLGMGCPVVASNTPDQMYVLNRSNGGICVPYDASAFAKAIIYILSHPEEARKMGKRGRAFILKERSYDMLANKIENVFQRLAEKRCVL